jgi:hypothetical protein
MGPPWLLPLLVPKHAAVPPVRLGIAEQTSAATGQLLTVGVIVIADDAHVVRACIAGSQPGNCTLPASVHTGSVDSAQRRNASICATQDGSSDDAISQLAAQVVPAAVDAQLVRAILSQVAEHDAATWSAEQ